MTLNQERCSHRRHVPVLLGIREPWKSNWEKYGFADERRMLAPMIGSGQSAYIWGQKCADCGAQL